MLNKSAIVLGTEGSLSMVRNPSHQDQDQNSRPKAALLFWFFGDFRCAVSIFIVIIVIYKYRNM